MADQLADARNRARGADPQPRDTMTSPLNPLQKTKAVGKVIRSLVPDQWLSWFSFDSWKDPVEIGLRLSILKIVFVVALLGLVIVVAMAAADALNPLN